LAKNWIRNINRLPRAGFPCGLYSAVFSHNDYRNVEVLADLLLPATEDNSHQPEPGTKEAGVAELISLPAAIPRSRRNFEMGSSSSCSFANTL
jgi:hypothetical protein